MYARARVLVEGSVQGVGFRNFVRSRANAQRVTGWVRNLDDGRVEAVFEGEKADIEHLIEICKRGSVFARVKDIRVLWEDEFERFSSFSIKHN
ncbi:MAG: acylphosphatase [Thaumarchaeota archaeon]|nr:acylphosphatase [Nitrososphaerota archaeon]